MVIYDQHDTQVRKVRRYDLPSHGLKLYRLFRIDRTSSEFYTLSVDALRLP